MGDEERAWQPMSREQFGDLRRGQHVQDRRGRVWMVVSEAYFEEGEDRINLRSGDLVRRNRQRYADDYMLVAAESARRSYGSSRSARVAIRATTATSR